MVGARSGQNILRRLLATGLTSRARHPVASWTSAGGRTVEATRYFCFQKVTVLSFSCDTQVAASILPKMSWSLTGS